MRHQIKRFFLCLLLFLAISAAKAKKNDIGALAIAVQAAQNKEIFCTATIGCYAVNLTKDLLLGGFNTARSMIPASTLKLLTTAAALETLGRDVLCDTIIQYDGKIDEEGILQGNIYIKDGGDFVLESRNLKDYYCRPHFIVTGAQSVQAKGIKKEASTVVGDAQIYADSIIPDTWVVGDLGEYYGAAVSGLSIFDKKYNSILQATEGHEKASLAGFIPSLPEAVQILLHVKRAAIDRDKVCISGWPYPPVRIIQGKILCGNQVIILEGISPDSAAYTLHRALEKQHIEVVRLPATVRRSTLLYEK